jgi:predicted 3-demethylubiquinone-9 3-methyltransferase (glyoxalase superfamily)
MALTKHKITPCLWFDTGAEEAAKFYVSVFKNSKLGKISRYGKGRGDPRQEARLRDGGRVRNRRAAVRGAQWRATVEFKLSEAVSFQVHCDTQEQIDYFWNALTKEGREQPCGWLKDKFGVSWQIVPTVLGKMMTDSDTEITQRVTKAFLKMKKFDLAKLRQAYVGQAA